MAQAYPQSPFMGQNIGGANYLLDKSFTNGNFFFVNSGTGSDTTNYGSNPASPFKTINYAAAQVTANNGDVILVLPGHTETITAAAGCTLAKAGTKVLGLGTGRMRPVINFTTANTATFTVTAANCWLENLVFTPLGFAAVASAVVVSAADCVFNNCEFELGNATNQAVLGILTTAGANRMIVQNCWFHNTSDAGVTAAVRIVGGTDLQIVNNKFQGAYSSGVGAIQGLTTDTKNLVVYGNVIQNLTASCTKAMVFTASSTGQISENLMQILSGTAPITGAAMSWVGANYYAAAIATAGTLI